MKAILVIVGLVLLIGGIYGFVTVGDLKLPTGLTDAVVDASNALGITGDLSFGDQVKVFLVDNRVILSIVGAVCLLVSALFRRK